MPQILKTGFPTAGRNSAKKGRRLHLVVLSSNCTLKNQLIKRKITILVRSCIYSATDEDWLVGLASPCCNKKQMISLLLYFLFFLKIPLLCGWNVSGWDRWTWKSKETSLRQPPVNPLPSAIYTISTPLLIWTLRRIAYTNFFFKHCCFMSLWTGILIQFISSLYCPSEGDLLCRQGRKLL